MRGKKRNGSVLTRPNGLHQNVETAILGREPEPARKKKRGIPVVGSRKMLTCALVVRGRCSDVSHYSKTTHWQIIKCTRKNGMCSER